MYIYGTQLFLRVHTFDTLDISKRRRLEGAEREPLLVFLCMRVYRSQRLTPVILKSFGKS